MEVNRNQGIFQNALYSVGLSTPNMYNFEIELSLYCVSTLE